MLRLAHGLCYSPYCVYYERSKAKGYVINVEIVEAEPKITAQITTNLIAKVLQEQYDYINNTMTEGEFMHLKKDFQQTYEFSIDDLKTVFATNDTKKISIQVYRVNWGSE